MEGFCYMLFGGGVHICTFERNGTKAREANMSSKKEPVTAIKHLVACMCT